MRSQLDLPGEDATFNIIMTKTIDFFSQVMLNFLSTPTFIYFVTVRSFSAPFLG